MLDEYIASLVGFPDDQIRYAFSFIASFLLAYVFRVYFHHSTSSPTTRHYYSLLTGLALCIYTFSARDTLILLSVVSISYTILLYSPPSHVHWYMMVYAIICALAAHLYCMIIDYGGWHVNYTGSLMVIVQRITYAACEVHDGMFRNDDDLSADQRRLQIKELPSMLDYFSYNFSFSNILAGPSCPYKEYDDYIRGDNMKLLDKPNKYARAKEHCHEPSPLYPSSIKAIKSLISLVIYMVLNYIVTLADIQEPALSIPLRLLLSYLLLFKTRCFYYFVFLISESICNASGLGFRGYDERGDAQWDLVQNVDIWEVELGTNIRGVVNGWNQMTSQWLRRCAYDRVSFNPTLCTFILSAIWHGLYPGYYICFVMFSVGTVAARKLRGFFHHRFQSPPSVKAGYDVASTLGACFWRDSCALPFVLLKLETVILVWGYYYYIPLVISIALPFIPARGKSTRNRDKTNTE